MHGAPPDRDPPGASWSAHLPSLLHCIRRLLCGAERWEAQPRQVSGSTRNIPIALIGHQCPAHQTERELEQIDIAHGLLTSRPVAATVPPCSRPSRTKTPSRACKVL